MKMTIKSKLLREIMIWWFDRIFQLWKLLDDNIVSELNPLFLYWHFKNLITYKKPYIMFSKCNTHVNRISKVAVAIYLLSEILKNKRIV